MLFSLFEMCSNNRFSITWLIFWCISVIIFGTLGIRVLSYGVAECVRIHQMKNSYTNTTCFVNNYYFQPRSCKSCVSDSGCTMATCYDEQFRVRYSIFNGSQIRSTIKLNEEKKHSEYRVGWIILIALNTSIIIFMYSRTEHGTHAGMIETLLPPLYGNFQAIQLA